uniref:Alpha/beta hydrolase n=1 Tax=Heterorhabditis bacteriophora TaxID=37862 RepID=A0A1I7XAZ1_HETBA
MADAGRGVVPANPGPSASSDQPAPSATAFQILASTVADPFSFPTPEENGRSFDLLRTRLG